MLAVDQWASILERLGADWDEARLSWTPEEREAMGESAVVLGPLGPGRIGSELRFQARRRGGTPRIRNLLGRLDEKRIWGTLTLVESSSSTPAVTPAHDASRALVDQWDEGLARLAPGWRDLLCELELDSSDYVPRAALLGAPLNPTRRRDALAIRFRVSSAGGYGTWPGMARRCLQRMDAEGITGDVTVLHGLSDTDNVYTQGPVWRIGGKSV